MDGRQRRGRRRVPTEQRGRPSTWARRTTRTDDSAGNDTCGQIWVGAARSVRAPRTAASRNASRHRRNGARSRTTVGGQHAAGATPQRPLRDQARDGRGAHGYRGRNPRRQGRVHRRTGGGLKGRARPWSQAGVPTRHGQAGGRGSEQGAARAGTLEQALSRSGGPHLAAQRAAQLAERRAGGTSADGMKNLTRTRTDGKARRRRSVPLARQPEDIGVGTTCQR